ncbi:hypothetical protein [Streptomyces canus]|uniref:Uncharacterized protein n=1 Tax=Streptomyces canus TaxID=58343 RepID=A0AAW8F9T1_9ACTN|nr:hypothetical protein [Streptomyces canus]MDQ0906582.1 hypothetical protein [Streptomyces canus]MDQ1066602.1 hypothetical protein [Streptomyces canus]
MAPDEDELAATIKLEMYASTLEPVLASTPVASGEVDLTLEMCFRRRTVIAGSGRILSSDAATDLYLVVSHAQGRQRRWIRSPERLPELAEAQVGLVQSFRPSSEPLHRAMTMPVVLSEELAGIAVHELVGHALEEQDLRAGERVLPGRARVTAGSSVVIDEGKALDALSDSVKCVHHLRAMHGLNSILRFPELEVQAESAEPAECEGPWLRCLAARGARYFGRVALFDVLHAEEWHGAELVWSGPVKFTLDHDRLTAGHFQPPDDGPLAWQFLGGECIKDGDALPSYVACPALTIPEVQVWPA